MKTKMAFSLKTGVAQVWRCHTTFETGVAAATLATTLWAPLPQIYGCYATVLVKQVIVTTSILVTRLTTS